MDERVGVHFSPAIPCFKVEELIALQPSRRLASGKQILCLKVVFSTCLHNSIICRAFKTHMSELHPPVKLESLWVGLEH